MGEGLAPDRVIGTGSVFPSFFVKQAPGSPGHRGERPTWNVSHLCKRFCFSFLRITYSTALD